MIKMKRGITQLIFKIKKKLKENKIQYIVPRCTASTTRCTKFDELGVHILLSSGNCAETNSFWNQGL